MTKLEALIEALRNIDSNYGENVEDQLILSYYKERDQNRKEFTVNDFTFTVLDSWEIYNELKPLAKDLLEDEIITLEGSRLPFLSFNLIDSIDKDSALEEIIAEMDFAVEFNSTLIDEIDSYYIYEI